MFEYKKVIFLFSLILISCSSPLYKGEISDHFNGETFFNPGKEHHDKSISELFKWKFLGDAKVWPNWVEIKQKLIPKKRRFDNDHGVTFINHSTLLIQLDGLNIITDPVWSKRTSPVSWAGPSRVKLPGVKFEEIPKIDVVLISHNHYDHMDMETLKKIYKRDKPVFIMGLGNSYYLESEGIQNIKELDWNESYDVNGTKFEFSKCQHWSRRTAFDYNRALWGSFSILGKTKKIYFAGDTGYNTHFKEAFARHGKYDLALLPIGAYAPRWFMKTAHMNPDESVRAYKDLGAVKAIGIHFGTFQLTDEGIDEPAQDLADALRVHGVKRDAFFVPRNGDTFVNF